MGLREKAANFRHRTDVVGILDNLTEFFEGKPLSKDDLSKLQSEINNRIKQVTAVLDRKLLDMNTLFEIVKELHSSLHVSDLLQVIIFTLIGQFQLSDVAILLYENGKLNITAKRGFDELSNIDFTPEFSEFLAEADSALIVNELNRFRDDFEKFNQNRMKVIIPMRGKDGLSGIIVLGNKLSGEIYNEEDKNFTFMMASLAGIALDNARLYDRLEQKYRELSTLYDVSAVINTTDDYEMVISLILETITTGFGVKKAIVLSSLNQEYKIQQILGIDADLNQKHYQLTDEEKKCIANNDVEVLEINPLLKSAIPDKQNCLFVPLNSLGSTVGIIIIFEFENYSIDSKNSALINLFAIIASQVAPPLLMTRMIKLEREKISDPFTPILKLIDDEVDKVDQFGIDITFGMLVLSNFNQYAEFYGSGNAFEKFEELSSKIKKKLPDTIESIRFSSNKLLFVMPAIAETDLEEVRSTITEISKDFFSEDREVDIGIHFLSTKYPTETQDKYAILTML